MDKQRIIRNVCMGLFFFLSGVEYAVILPTLNGYLETFDAKQSFLGIVLAAFSFSGLIAAPVYGRITDKTKSTKLCVIIANCFEIVGNFLYAISSNKYMVLGARLIAGVGSGVASSVFGMITRTTSPEERTSVFSLFMALRQIGMLAGPAFNVPLHMLNFYIGPFHVNDSTSPGFLMAIIWIIHTILVAVLYRNTESNTPQVSTSHIEPKVNGYSEISERDAGLVERKARSTSIFEEKKVKNFVNEFLRDQVIVCLAATFMVMFSQTGLETDSVPLTKRFFGWTGLENSYLFCVSAAVVIVTFAAISFLSKRFTDRVLMLAGCIGLVLTYAMFFVYSLIMYMQETDSQDFKSPSWLLPVFAINVIMLVVSIPFVWVPQAALFSKITSPETQSFNQGIRIAAMGLGQIIGPIWAASLVSLEMLPIMIGVDLLLSVLLTTMTCLSYKRLVDPATRLPVNGHSTTKVLIDSERAPLLSHHEAIN